jgi:hypothetical protein
MLFRTKDLMITVLPRAAVSGDDVAKACLWETRICRSPSVCFYYTCLVGGTFPTTGDIFCRPHSVPTYWLQQTWQTDCTRPRTNPTFVGNQPWGTDCTRPHTLPPQWPCGPWSHDPCGPWSRDPWVINDREDLEALRQELKETLEQLDDLEKDLPSGIRTKDEARQIESVLRQVIRTAKGLK